MGSVLKTLAIAVGAGVAFGLCTTAGSRRAPATAPRRDSVLDLEPLLDRLESMERRFDTPAPEAVSELARRIDAQDAEIVRIREMVDVRATEIEARLEAQMDQRQQRSLATIEKTVEFKVSERIAALERMLSEQSASIDSLRTRAQETDANLKRLIVAIERLCDRTQPVAAASPVSAAGPVVVPFEAHLDEARSRDEAPVPEFRPTLFREPEPEAEPKKSRFPLKRIFGMIAIVVLTQVMR
jgi:hypothetical protein